MMPILNGIRVVDQGTFITGACSGAMLADLGADVIKIESKGGDPFRHYEGSNYSSHFQAHNRNKRGLCLDLKDADDQEIFTRLIGAADVYIQNFRPGVAAQLGAGPVQLQARNPRLVYCSISGFGQSGPYADRPCYDTVAQSLSGFLSTIIDPDNPRIPGPAIADTVTGIYAALGIMAALVERGRTGIGRHVEISMLEAIMHFSTEAYFRYFSSGELRTDIFDRPRAAHAFIVRCQSGDFIGLHLSQLEKFWTSLVTAMDAPRIGDDPRFSHRSGRIKNYVELLAELNAVFATRPRSEWIERLTAHDVPFAPINSLPEAIEDQQVRHANIVVPVNGRQEGAEQAIRSPFGFDGVRDETVASAPLLDQHSAAIRRALANGKTAWPER